MPHAPDLYTRWSLEVRSKGLFRAGQRVGAAVSGGPDSVLLVHFMKAFAREGGLALSVVHFNHHLRGEESDGDESFVRELAGSLGLAYLRGEADVGRVARERHGNVEAIARELRYRYFYSLVEHDRLDLVATGHTANDQAETVLMRLLRGTGTRGLGGIYPVLDGKVVRPFLSVRRDEVMHEVAARQLRLREDSSNLNLRLLRNKVRKELLPLLENQYNPRLISLLNQFAERAREDEACLERLARERAHPWRAREGTGERIPIRVLVEFPPSLARRVLRQMLQTVRGTLHGIDHAHIESLRRFIVEAQSGKVQNLPGGDQARKEFSWLVLTPGGANPAPPDFSYPVTIPGELAVPELGCSFHFKILRRDDIDKAYNDGMHVGLDPQRLCNDLVLRNWRAGDRFCPAGSRSVRKLKELFREAKIPQARRKGWPVLLCGGKIVWVRGFPPDKGVAVTGQSQQVLIVEEEAG